MVLGLVLAFLELGLRGDTDFEERVGFLEDDREDGRGRREGRLAPPPIPAPAGGADVIPSLFAIEL